MPTAQPLRTLADGIVDKTFHPPDAACVRQRAPLLLRLQPRAQPRQARGLGEPLAPGEIQAAVTVKAYG